MRLPTATASKSELAKQDFAIEALESKVRKSIFTIETLIRESGQCDVRRWQLQHDALL